MKLLLLVHSEADVARLDGAARAILNTAINGVWCVFSPAVTVNTGEAAAKLDAEIGQLKSHERAAAERGDYAAAAGYKTNREGKELDKAKALREAWKLAPAEERTKKTQEIFGPIGEKLKAAGLNARFTAHSDHYDREQWVQMLNSLSGVWFKEFTPGSFLVAWPESVETMVKQGWAEIAKTVLPVVPATGKPIAPVGNDGVAPGNDFSTLTPAGRRAELEALHPMKLGPLMRTLGLDAEGKTRAEKIEAIIAHEMAKEAGAPEPVDAY